VKESIRELRRLASELESYIYCDNSEKTLELTDQIINMATAIKRKLNKEDIIKEDRDEKITGFKLISTVTFLYKPVTVKNYFDGDYLERFSEERTNELMKAGVLELHDKFWTSNNVERGNIFGSIPEDLIPKDSMEKLLSYGWKNTEVSVYETEKEIKLTELIKHCDSKLKNYLVTTEMKNRELLVLHYKIKS